MSSLLACPRCGLCPSRVFDSRNSWTDNSWWRRRHCKSCGHKFTTIEAVNDDPGYPLGLDAKLYRQRWERERSRG